MILAGDVGGTKTVLGLFEEEGNGLRCVRRSTLVNAEHATFDAVVEAFLASDARLPLGSVCLGVAGAVIDGRVHTTNLGWDLSESELAERLQVSQVRLLNDLEAAAYGVLFLDASELCSLNPHSAPDRPGNAAVIAAGTGLGEAILFWDRTHYHPIASEGGHTDFGPRNDEEIALLRYLRAKLGGHVSYERILCGAGLYDVYSFLRDSGFATESEALREQLGVGDPSVTISTLGLAGKEPLCTKALAMFSEIYGAEAGNLALKCLALGGVYITGGIAPKILPALQDGSFLRGFFDKGRFRPLLEALPVRVAINSDAPLIGAAYYGRRLLL